MSVLYAVDLLGTFVFAISGAIAASNKKLDVFGAIVIAFATALGGGTIRDVLIGSQPVGWMKDLNYTYLIIAAVLVSLFFKKHILKLRKTMFLFDTIGIGLFTVLGLQKTLTFGLSPVIAVMMGTVSAVFGGVLRDIFINVTPLIFRREVYATACVTGGIIYLLFDYMNLGDNLSILLTVGYIIVIRILAVRYKWKLVVMR